MSSRSSEAIKLSKFDKSKMEGAFTFTSTRPSTVITLHTVNSRLKLTDIDHALNMLRLSGTVFLKRASLS